MTTTLDKLLKRQRTEHWGSSYRFKPALLDKVYGDGKQLLQVFPINERPRYWVVRVDSKCIDRIDDDSFFDMLDDIYEQIDEQFGPPDEGDLGIGNDRPYFPSYDGQGVSWNFVRELQPKAQENRT
jgi:hypothetical protein